MCHFAMVRGLSWHYTDNSFLLNMEPSFSPIFCGATAVNCKGFLNHYLSLTVVLSIVFTILEEY